ncbi:hypothetical protein V8D89_000199 [Ganoderma adspersum]
MDHSSLATSQLREPEKACVSQPSSTTLDLQDGVAQTFVVDLALLGGRDQGESRKDVQKSTPTGEHETDDTRSAPPSPHELPEKTPLPPLSVDVPPSSLPPTTDSERIDTPIEPPGLPRPVDDATTEVEETAPAAAEDGDTERATPSCFSLSGLEPLRTLIPDNLLPDDLLVFDPDSISKLDTDDTPDSKSDKPVRYVRVFPQPKASQEPLCADGSSASDRPARVARLYLKENNVLGGGHHSSVYSAPLRLRLSADSEEESTVRVGVKTAFARCGAHEMLRREAVAYNAFPRHLMEDKFPAVEPPQPAAPAQANSATPEGVVAHGETGDATGTAAAAPASTSESSDSESDDDSESTDEGDKCSSTHTPPREPAVVPKFFGYYAAVDADGRVIQHAHPKCDKDATCAVPWPTRLLLVEECGKPVVLNELTYDQRTACFELFKRLHAAGFTQGSIYERNILVQPGPLAAPPEDRSGGTPSFRIIDFGRMKTRTDFKSPGSGQRFAKECKEEREWAYDVLVGAFNRWY